MLIWVSQGYFVGSRCSIGEICRYFSSQNTPEKPLFVKIYARANGFNFYILSEWPCSLQSLLSVESEAPRSFIAERGYFTKNQTITVAIDDWKILNSDPKTEDRQSHQARHLLINCNLKKSMFFSNVRPKGTQKQPVQVSSMDLVL